MSINFSSHISCEPFLNATGKLRFSLMNDYLFRAVLQENTESLKHLISALLSISYGSIVSCTITNPITLGKSFDSKTIIMDVRVLLNENTLINLEMQMGNLGIWPIRSLYYLCRLYCNLERGRDYNATLPSIHIGILPHSPFSDITDFYSEYFLMNHKNHHIFTRNFSLRMLCLDQLENVPEEERSSELYIWAKLFAATTWEEIHMLAKHSEIIKNTASTIYNLSAEENIRLQCEARERYEHDVVSLLNFGKKEGKTEATRQINQLIRLLLQDNRISDLEKAASDLEFQKKLLAEYGLLNHAPDTL